MTDNIKKWMEGLTREEEDELDHRVGKDFDIFQKRLNNEKN
jgi:hypothetical protein